jgi:hypothetical protein
VPALRPRVRIPLWAAVIAGAAFLVLIALRIWAARSMVAHERDREREQQVRGEDAAPDDQGPPPELG